MTSQLGVMEMSMPNSRAILKPTPCSSFVGHSGGLFPSGAGGERLGRHDSVVVAQAASLPFQTTPSSLCSGMRGSAAL